MSWIDVAATQLERYFNIPAETGRIYVNRLVVTIAAAVFLLLSTVIVAFDSIFPGQSQNVAQLEIGDVVQDDVFAPNTVTYTSDVLTRQRREAAAQAVNPTLTPPDPSVARQQTDLARQILDFINNVRRDPYGLTEQKIQDVQQVRALDLDETIIIQIIDIAQETWSAIDAEIIAILERVMRGEIENDDLPRLRAQLPTQVSVRFNDDREIAVIVALVSDLLRANTGIDEEATEIAREAARQTVSEESRSFAAGQLVIPGGSVVDEADFEALQRLGLLEQTRNQTESVSRALLASVIVMVVMGLYIARFRPSLMQSEPRFLTLLAAIFIVTLFGAQLGLNGQILVYPAAAMALLYVAIIGPEIAVIGMIGLAFLIGLMDSNVPELTMYFALSGVIGALTLQQSERLNSFFFAGLMVGISNMAVIALFNVSTSFQETSEILVLILLAFMNGIISAATAIAALYIVTQFFNLPTALKLVELSQPNQPLLQRMLREAPGTYQHSLQVSNLSEQACNAIGANSELTRVAALYHDIGKMLNPVFFTENQGDSGNPHDALNDPYRSADIIISHITEGDNLARQSGLPNRIRDFIREHHGTSEVFVFYRQAVILADDDEEQVDINEFTYPGPKPQSRETGVMMLADSCEATVRARQPKTKQEIEEIVAMVVDGKRKAGQLDESGLTLNDLKQIHEIFIDVLQGMYHPRINYSQAISRVRTQPENPTSDDSTPSVTKPEAPARKTPTQESKSIATTTEVEATPSTPSTATPSKAIQPVRDDEDDDEDTPLAEVPRLRRTVETNAYQDQESEEKSPNGTSDAKEDATPDERQNDS